MLAVTPFFNHTKQQMDNKSLTYQRKALRYFFAIRDKIERETGVNLSICANFALVNIQFDSYENRLLFLAGKKQVCGCI